MSMRHCGNAYCLGTTCDNWQMCRGETVPPWRGTVPSESHAVVIRLQDVLDAADALARSVLDGEDGETLAALASAYIRERKGVR